MDIVADAAVVEVVVDGRMQVVESYCFQTSSTYRKRLGFASELASSSKMSNGFFL